MGGKSSRRRVSQLLLFFCHIREGVLKHDWNRLIDDRIKKGRDRVFKIGLRNIKTAISVAICILVLGLLGVRQPFFACMTAVYTMQANVATSLEAGLSRFLGTVAGAITGTTFAALCKLLPMQYLLVRAVVIPLGTVFVVHILHLLGRKDSVFIACIVYFALMMKVEQVSVLDYAEIGRASCRERV